MNEARQRWLLVLLTAFTFLFLLGSRALNEPDEGRYSEIAREMIVTGDWVVPHLWYLPHLDKPPLTYWLVAVSMKWFGQNEWALRLPLALAGLSGVWAAFLLGSLLGGRRAGFWSAVILQSSLLYFAMARMLTTDMFLTQFTAWAVHFFWRSWLAATSGIGNRKSGIVLWNLAGWAAIALGFLAKGPIALAVPLLALAAVAVFRLKIFKAKKLLWGGLAGGFALFLVLTLPWFLAVFRRVPQSAHYMILGQVAGHLLGTTIKNRKGGPFYFFAILAVGLLPWTFLLGWLWRRAHWHGLDEKSKGAWLLLNVWVFFPFALFSFSEAKLPAYILPIFPALAVMLAWRFFSGKPAAASAPKWAWQVCLAGAVLLPTVFPWLLKYAFRDALPARMTWQTPAAVGTAVVALWLARNRRPPTVAAFAAGLALLGFFATVAEIPPFETSLRDNQTLKPLGQTLRERVHPGDAVVCWGKFPEGLPFYAGAAMSATNRPYLGDMDLTQVPFEFPGNRQRLGDRLLPDENALVRLLSKKNRVWIVGFGDTVERFEQAHQATPLDLVTNVGQWKLFVSR
ncbi:MAG: glycosyltransferase family 39 protein [Verrucomicrobiota bacterium]|nr:glycosyltransferase family 39 protein [Verrucomicrobiota bacterium]MDE3068093.1 glycosyltransferase family 39 protein [Verrucomicrobiota bacterium]